MVIRPNEHVRRGQAGWLMIELLVAITLLVAALLPMAYSFASERRMARSVYQRAVAMEIVDGEAEVLAAGAWRDFSPGEHDYRTRAAAATNLPPGRFVLSVKGEGFRLEWKPGVVHHGGPVVREVRVK